MNPTGPLNLPLGGFVTVHLTATTGPQAGGHRPVILHGRLDDVYTTDGTTDGTPVALIVDDDGPAAPLRRQVIPWHAIAHIDLLTPTEPHPAL